MWVCSSCYGENSDKSDRCQTCGERKSHSMDAQAQGKNNKGKIWKLDRKKKDKKMEI